ncbi:MAG: M18 family aminopeptidase [FCB group bacterium]|nr:M18 family aminopeptidase [FCB group bacterium]MBL7027604.1 M18 family aminopeptidase [Candidatus Neomarinimicrobiota bacterium]MBL7121234.1 M18 family aminopeptidase [Candidatus Neomarinimicrobiota bacterium]
MNGSIITELISYLNQSVTAYHAVITAEATLKSNGFIRLDEQDVWDLKPNQKYYVIRSQSALAAWQMGRGDKSGIRLVGAHTDSPGLHLKPKAQYSKSGYVQLGVEVYGGPLLASWTDRDLSLAGRVILKEAGKLKVVPFKSNKVLLRIPQLAIHLNREVNEKGLMLNKQTHMPPILALESTDGPSIDAELIEGLIADELKVTRDEIASWQLECYDTQSANTSGLNDEFIVSGRIDNLTMCHASIQALTSTAFSAPQTAMIALFDNEEIGSSTENGAASGFIRDIITRVVGSDDSNHMTQRTLANSACISADGAHAIHPNYIEFHDPQHAVKMNQGPVIKVNANHRYATSAFTSAIFEQLCKDVDVPVQHYVHKTDLPCGSTIGPITATGLGIPVVDVGNAMLSMHSIRETAGAKDHEMMIKVLERFFSKADLVSVS